MQTIICECKRCRRPYELLPGRPLVGFCETCKRILGSRLTEAERVGMRERFEFEKRMLNRGGQDPLRVFSLPPNAGKK